MVPNSFNFSPFYFCCTSYSRNFSVIIFVFILLDGKIGLTAQKLLHHKVLPHVKWIACLALGSTSRLEDIIVRVYYEVLHSRFSILSFPISLVSKDSTHPIQVPNKLLCVSVTLKACRHQVTLMKFYAPN